jgi:hypothetical protein
MLTESGEEKKTFCRVTGVSSLLYDRTMCVPWRVNWRNFRKAGRFLAGPAKSLPGKKAKQNMIPESRSAATLLH